LLFRFSHLSSDFSNELSLISWEIHEINAITAEIREGFNSVNQRGKISGINITWIFKHLHCLYNLIGNMMDISTNNIS
jgi:hypothetical protein